MSPPRDFIDDAVLDRHASDEEMDTAVERVWQEFWVPLFEREGKMHPTVQATASTRRILTAMTRFILLVVVAFTGLVSVAFADTPDPHLVLSPDQTWLAIIGALVPLVTYWVNHHAPWIAEPVKSIVLVVVSGAVGAVYKLVETNGIAWNGATAQYILTGIVSALVAHNFLYKPAGINTKLGAGTDAPKRKK